MTTIQQAVLIIYVSPNGRDNWKPVEPSAVPEWLKEPEVIGRLVKGEMAMDPQSKSGSDWFRAKRVLTPEEKAAQARRERRQAKRVVH